MVGTFLRRLPVALGMKEQAQRAGKRELVAGPAHLSVEAGGHGLGALLSAAACCPGPCW